MINRFRGSMSALEFRTTADVARGPKVNTFT